MKDRTSSIKYIFHGIILPITLLIIAAGFVLIVYNLKMNESSEKRAYRLLTESAEAQSVAMEERRKSSFQQLDIISKSLDWDRDIYEDESVAAKLKILAEESQFANIAISDKRGIMLYQNGNTNNCSDRSYFKEAISGKLCVEFVKTGRMSGNKVFVFAAPVYRNGQIAGAIMGTRNLDDIVNILGNNDENGQYNFLCYKSGEIVSVPPDCGLPIAVGGKINSHFRDKDGTIEIIPDKVCKYTYNGQTYYGIYMPSGFDDVFIFSAATRGYASNLAGLYNKWAVMVSMIIFVLTMAVATVIIVRLKQRISIVKAYELERTKKLEEYHSFQSRRSLNRSNILSSFHINITKNICDDTINATENIVKIKSGCSADEFCEAVAEHIHPSDREKYMHSMSCSALMAAFGNGKTTIQNDFLFYGANKRYIWLRIIADLVRNPMTDDLEALTYAVGINNEKRLEQIGKKLITENFEGMGLVDICSGLVFGIKAIGGKHIIQNNALKEGMDYDRAALSTLANYLSKFDFEYTKENVKLEHIKMELEHAPSYSVTIHVYNEEQKEDKYYKINYSYLDKRRESIILSCEDITAILASKMDVETGLYNSTGFHEKVSEWIRNNPGKKYRIYRYDLDGFKNINGTYGYDAGNKILRDMGKYMRAHSMEDSFAAHLNADHFVRFCSEDYLTPEQSYADFLKYFADYEIHYPISLHIGVYDLCEENCDSFTMSYKAHLALQSIKGDLSTHIAYYRKGLMESTKNQQELLSEVEKAVGQEQFEIWLQPQFDYGGSIVGAEALVRWRHPEKGLIQPADFIPLLEKSKQITLVDNFVWNRSCRYIKELRDKGIALPISVNVSRIDIRSEEICKEFEQMIKKYNIPAEMLRIEVPI